MKFRFGLTALFLLGTAAAGWAQWKPVPPEFQEPLSPRIANYEMDATLDVAARTVHGREILTWHNKTAHSTDRLPFHLYYNAWNNEQSSMLSSVRGTRGRLSDYRENEWAYCRVKKIRLLGEEGWQETDLMPTMKFIQPDDGNPQDRTVMQVSLPRPIHPGETLKLEIEWDAKVPRTFARTGARDDYFFIAQWFPKIGVLEEDGTWNCHQFIQTEFFADFGVYDVRLTVPTGWIVGATGKEVQTRNNGDGTTTHRFYQEDVHDFAWVTSPHFKVFTKLFDEANLPRVNMRLLLMPDHLSKRDRYFAATAAALKYYGTWWGPYPYDHITIVDPAYGSRTGGMEYPTFFSGGTRWLSPRAARSPEGVTVHECGHQFWYGIVANNEFEDAWLDEGFNTYSTSRTMEVAFPGPVLVRRYLDGFLPVVYGDIPLAERTRHSNNFFGLYSDYKRDRMAQPSWKCGPNGYRVNAYDKPAHMLRTLENLLGWPTFQKVMSTYFDRWKFKHPKPKDFFAVVNEVTGKDYSWFFDQVYAKANVLDYAVERVDYRKLTPRHGYVYADGKFVPVAEAEPDSVASGARSTVFIRRWGEMILPVEIKITFAGGDTVLEHWSGAERWTRFDYYRPERIVKVEVDPYNKLVLDVNSLNNSWLAKTPAGKAAIKWAAKWLVWLQNLVEFFAFFV